MRRRIVQWITAHEDWNFIERTRIEKLSPIDRLARGLKNRQISLPRHLERALAARAYAAYQKTRKQ
jgi:hypothetical protein